MKKKLLVVVDMQNDFVTGELGTDEAQRIVSNVVAKINKYKQDGDYIVYTMDTHDKGYLETQEGRNLPVEHCIYRTQGWQLHPDIAAALKGAESFRKISCAEYRKPVFGSWDLAVEMQQYQDRISEIEFVGVCTGICVLSNVVLIKTRLPEMPVKVDAGCCACVTPESHETALKAMKLLQVEIGNE